MTCRDMYSCLCGGWGILWEIPSAVITISSFVRAIPNRISRLVLTPPHSPLSSPMRRLPVHVSPDPRRTRTSPGAVSGFHSATVRHHPAEFSREIEMRVQCSCAAAASRCRQGVFSQPLSTGAQQNFPKSPRSWMWSGSSSRVSRPWAGTPALSRGGTRHRHCSRMLCHRNILLHPAPSSCSRQRGASPSVAVMFITDPKGFALIFPTYGIRPVVDTVDARFPAIPFQANNQIRFFPDVTTRDLPCTGAPACPGSSFFGTKKNVERTPSPALQTFSSEERATKDRFRFQGVQARAGSCTHISVYDAQGRCVSHRDKPVLLLPK